MKLNHLALILLLLTNSTLARTLSEIQKSGKVIVATNGTFAPFSFYKSNKLTGFEIDLAEALATELNVKVEWKVVPFDSTLIGLNQNRYDFVIVSHGITAERAKIVDFTDAYYCTGAVILTKSDGPSKREELKGKVLGTQVGTTYYKYLKELPGNLNILTFKSEADTLMALQSGRIQVMVGDKFAVMATQKSRPEAKLKLGELLFQERIGMAVQKNNKDLLSAINKALAKLQSNGTYEKISNAYFNEDIRCK